MDDELISHIESALGALEADWARDQSDAGVIIKRVVGQPTRGTTTYVTLGVSRQALRVGGERVVKQEFITIAQDRFSGQHVASFLESFAEFVLSSGRALVRGDVFGPSESVLPRTPLSAVYAAAPVLRNPGLRVLDASDPPTEFLWALPIHAAEAELVRAEGWRRFEERLLDAVPNLGDLNRESVA